MPDRVLFPLMGLSAVLMITLALVWPQGLGARSPGPFGHAPVLPDSAARRAVAAPVTPSMLSLAPAPSSGAAR
jgi:hypothetical protein